MLVLPKHGRLGVVAQTLGTVMTDRSRDDEVPVGCTNSVVRRGPCARGSVGLGARVDAPAPTAGSATDRPRAERIDPAPRAGERSLGLRPDRWRVAQSSGSRFGDASAERARPRRHSAGTWVAPPPGDRSCANTE